MAPKLLLLSYMKISTPKPFVALLAASVIGLTLFSQQAQALPVPGNELPNAQIVGNITFSGGVQLNTASAGTATAVIGWLDQTGNMPTVESRDGNFTAFVAVNAPATFSAPWSFNSGPLSPFWQVGGFTFSLTSSTILFQGGGLVNVSLTGIVTGNGFDPTPFTGLFSSQDPGAGNPQTFSFSASFGSQGVPEGGATAALLGLGLAGLAGLQRRLRTVK